jgi:hypothetical protein
MRTVANLDAQIRDDFLISWGRNVVRMAKKNLKDFHAERVAIGQRTGWKGDLIRTIRIEDVRGDTIFVSFGDDLPYANVHNIPRNDVYTIVARNVPKLVFPDRRFKKSGKVGKLVRVVSAERPTSGFMGEAVESGNAMSQELIDDAIDKNIKWVEKNTAYTYTSRGGKAWAFGSISAEKATMRGLIKPSAGRRDARILTAKGKKYRATKVRRKSRRDD